MFLLSLTLFVAALALTILLRGVPSGSNKRQIQGDNGDEPTPSNEPNESDEPNEPNEPGDESRADAGSEEIDFIPNSGSNAMDQYMS